MRKMSLEAVQVNLVRMDPLSDPSQDFQDQEGRTWSRGSRFLAAWAPSSSNRQSELVSGGNFISHFPSWSKTDAYFQPGPCGWHEPHVGGGKFSGLGGCGGGGTPSLKMKWVCSRTLGLSERFQGSGATQGGRSAHFLHAPAPGEGGARRVPGSPPAAPFGRTRPCEEPRRRWPAHGEDEARSHARGRGGRRRPLPAQVAVGAARVLLGALGGGGAPAALGAVLGAAPLPGHQWRVGRSRGAESARLRRPRPPRAGREYLSWSAEGACGERAGRTRGEVAPRPRGPGESLWRRRVGSAARSCCSGMTSLEAGLWGWGPCNSTRIWKSFLRREKVQTRALWSLLRNRGILPEMMSFQLAHQQLCSVLQFLSAPC